MTTIEPSPRRSRKRGRPPRAGTRARERIEFVVTAEERARLQQVAQENGSNVATVMREAVLELVSALEERQRLPPKA